MPKQKNFWKRLIELQIMITSWTIISLAGGPLGKVEKRERRGEKKEKNWLTSHLQQANLGFSTLIGAHGC